MSEFPTLPDHPYRLPTGYSFGYLHPNLPNHYYVHREADDYRTLVKLDSQLSVCREPINDFQMTPEEAERRLEMAPWQREDPWTVHEYAHLKVWTYPGNQLTIFHKTGGDYVLHWAETGSSTRHQGYRSLDAAKAAAESPIEIFICDPDELNDLWDDQGLGIEVDPFKPITAQIQAFLLEEHSETHCTSGVIWLNSPRGDVFICFPGKNFSE